MNFISKSEIDENTKYNLTETTVFHQLPPNKQICICLDAVHNFFTKIHSIPILKLRLSSKEQPMRTFWVYDCYTLNLLIYLLLLSSMPKAESDSKRSEEIVNLS